jgi:hypothetical protein
VFDVQIVDVSNGAVADLVRSVNDLVSHDVAAGQLVVAEAVQRTVTVLSMP